MSSHWQSVEGILWFVGPRHEIVHVSSSIPFIGHASIGKPILTFQTLCNMQTTVGLHIGSVGSFWPWIRTDPAIGPKERKQIIGPPMLYRLTPQQHTFHTRSWGAKGQPVNVWGCFHHSEEHREHRALPGLCVWLRSYALEWHRIWRWRAWLEVLRPIPGAATEIVGASKGPLIVGQSLGKTGENLWGVAKAQKGVWFCVILPSGQCVGEHLDLGLKWVWWMWMDVG